MKLDVSELISNPDSSKILDGHLDSEVFEIDGFERTLTNTQPFKINLNMIEKDKLHITLETHLTVLGICDRCLEEVSLDFEVSIDETFGCEDGELVALDADDEYGYISGSYIDIDGLIKEDILINWPLKILCRDDCKGLCPKCGVNLNIIACDCDNTVLDPRMAQFLDFI